MSRIVSLVVSAAINASTIPALATECTTTKAIDASHARWAMVRSQPANAADTDKTCRACATAFYGRCR
jgi:hypothetical protein